MLLSAHPCVPLRLRKRTLARMRHAPSLTKTEAQKKRFPDRLTKSLFWFRRRRPAQVKGRRARPFAMKFRYQRQLDRCSAFIQRSQRHPACWLHRTDAIRARIASLTNAGERIASCDDGALRSDQALSWSRIGSVRMRLPVAAKIALHSAGAIVGVAASPTPDDAMLHRRELA